MTSLGLATDLMLARWSGEVLDRGDHQVVRTPDEPDYWTGNAIVVPAQPVDLDRWERWFAAGHPSAVHRTVLVDGDLAADTAGAAAARGYQVRRVVVLTTQAAPVAPPVAPAPDLAAAAEPAPGVTVRALAGDDDWDAQLMLTIACDELEAPRDERYRGFIADRLAAKRAWVEAGRGAWWGAFAADRLVGSLGLFHAHGLGRYQDVVTHPDHRRQGLASALLAAAGGALLAGGLARTLVIQAAGDSEAARLYPRVGFAPAGVLTELLRRPPPVG